ncbi:hypothetical protein, partial [Heyndrickxia coagulans]|uniref:hypothetical protein n=1 Tax=Heyndrickxia coagulans TaxID=1398 RepID=UPI001C2BF763
YTEQVKHGSRKCTKRVSWNTRYLNLVEKNLTHTEEEGDSSNWGKHGKIHKNRCRAIKHSDSLHSRERK